MDYGLLIMDDGFLIMDYGLLIMDYGLLIMDYGFIAKNKFEGFKKGVEISGFLVPQIYFWR